MSTATSLAGGAMVGMGKGVASVTAFLASSLALAVRVSMMLSTGQIQMDKA